MTRPMHFLHITTFYPPESFGGDGVYVSRLARALVGRGHEVDVVHCVDSYRLLHPGDPEADAAPVPGVTVHCLRSPLGALGPIASHQTGGPAFRRSALRRILARKRWDVIHFHNVSLFGPKVLALEPDAGEWIKAYTTHDQWLVCPTHVLWKFGRVPCERPQCLACVLRARRPPQLWRYGSLLERAVRHVDLFLAPSRFTAEIHAERGFRQPFEVLPNFADRCDREWQEPGPPPHPRPYFLFVGRLEPVKGVGTLLRCWPEVEGADLLIAGTGSEELPLRAAASGTRSIRFLGSVPAGRLGRYYAHAIATIVPSVTYESFPMVVPESLSRRTPVVARDLGGLGEVVAESGAGIVFRTDEELLAAVRALLADRRLRDDLAERGYGTFVERWSTERHVESYLGLLAAAARRRYGRVPWESAS